MFSSPQTPERFWGPNSVVLNGPWNLSAGVNQPEREADHLPPPSTEVKNAFGYTSTPPYVLMAWCLVK
jgi:hypothetical protein